MEVNITFPLNASTHCVYALVSISWLRGIGVKFSKLGSSVVFECRFAAEMTTCGVSGASQRLFLLISSVDILSLMHQMRVSLIHTGRTSE